MGSRKAALITGATSGIGKAFAEAFAQKGFDLILAGRREKEIGKTAEEISRRYGVKAKVIIAELAKPRDLAKLEAAARRETGIEVLVNNAGFGHRKGFLQESADSSAAMVAVHVLAPLRLSRAVVPRMISRGRGAIINVASLAAFLPAPRSGMYSATKAFLHMFSESLFMDARPYGVRVQSLCPGFTHTDFHRKLGILGRPKSRGLLRWMSAEQVVGASLKALDRSKLFCIPGVWNKIAFLLISLVPRRIYFALAGRAMRNAFPVLDRRFPPAAM